MNNEIETIVKNCRNFFETNQTKSYEFRLSQLLKLQEVLDKNKKELLDALYSDLHKTKMEGFFSEFAIVRGELKFAIKHLKKWMKPKRVPTSIAHFKSSSRIVYEPFGTVLIMSPWNYPLNLTLAPLVGAIAAGNCSVVKPSNYSPATSALLKKIISENFPPEYISVITGGREENSKLLEERFDYIFFTGGTTVGKLVMEAASKYVTPITLELGGKSPCVVEKSANLKVAARRIAFGKYLNAGQTCVAPDYLLIQDEVKEKFIEELKAALKEFFPTETYLDMHLPRIVNEKHFDRLMGLIEGEKIIIGGTGEKNRKFIEPTVLDNITFDSKIMQEEIFGPLLPVISFKTMDEAIKLIKSREKPLASYLFTTDANIEKKFLNEVSFGGGCINDTIVHLASDHLPFGGVGFSGMGKYHGDESFKVFSNAKSILKKSNLIDIKLRYHPYSEKKLTIIDRMM
ncbi:aldehyde dehydrogenase [Treponema sp. OMZ 787]|uniref:aldehyde dehydrogenase n=1 Tax=Treponema sp. OMZ 787 TaxID=2563669 RepID=UPI0020A34E05|nr:aldehyde dehydrogenase [Treponema sp. OMZ 787]UTC63111.1 aldehyde dehydrogenase [Treponema sp. OMZ 787]